LYYVECFLTKFGNDFSVPCDSQFQKAGFDPDKIYECHGTLSYLQCTEPECDEVWEAMPNDIPYVDDNLQPTSPLPICPTCGAFARPNVSMFGDTNFTWKDSRATVQKHAFLKWLRKVYGNLDEAQSLRRSQRNKRKGQMVILEIGCGISLHSIRMEVELLLSQNTTENSVHCIRINPTNSAISPGNVGIGLGSREALQEIMNHMAQKNHSQI